jgi:hypothetical protein
MSIKYDECVTAFCIHASFLRRIILSSVACLALPYFSELLHKQNDFRRKVIEHTTRILIFYTTCPKMLLFLEEFSEI